MADNSDLYVLADGTHAAPSDCSKGEDGVLRHKSGMAVAMRSTGEPLTIGVAAEEGGNAAAAEAGREPAEEAETEAEKGAPEARPAPASAPKTEEPKPAARDVKAD